MPDALSRMTSKGRPASALGALVLVELVLVVLVLVLDVPRSLAIAWRSVMIVVRSAFVTFDAWTAVLRSLSALVIRV